MGIEEEAWEEWSENMDSVADIDDYSYCQGDGEPDTESFEKLLELEESLGPVTVLHSVLVMLDEKKGANFQLQADEDVAEKYISVMQDAGVNVAVGRGLERRDYVVYDVYITRDRSYGKEFFDSLNRRRDLPGNRVDREMGEFFGFPEEDIDAYVRDNGFLRSLRNFIARFLPVEHVMRTHTLSPGELVERYGDEDERDEIVGLNFRVVRDSREGLEEARKIAERRKEALSRAEGEYGVDLLWLVEEVADRSAV